MSVVIVGGNECMVRQYKELCRNLKNIGLPDLLVLFTSTVSHKMVRSALEQTKGKPVRTVRSHTSSINALRGILEGHMAESGEGMYV